MDKLTEARAVLAPKRRVSSDTSTTGSLTGNRPFDCIFTRARIYS